MNAISKMADVELDAMNREISRHAADEAILIWLAYFAWRI
jgi:hypothetical protein